MSYDPQYFYLYLLYLSNNMYFKMVNNYKYYYKKKPNVFM